MHIYPHNFPMTTTYTTGGSAAIAVASTTQADVYSRITDPIHAVERLGEMIATSGLFGCTKIEQGQVLALQCISERMPPLELAKTYHLIEGKLSMRSDAMLAKFQLSGGKVRWVRRDDKIVEAVFSMAGSELPFVAKFDDFVANGVAVNSKGQIKDNWRKFPRQMLTARVVSEAVRLLAPQIVFGVYTPEEVSDFAQTTEPKVVTPTPTPAPAAAAVQPASPIETPAAVEVAANETSERLREIIGDSETEANAFLVARNYIPVGSTYRDVPQALADRIIANPKAFISAVKERASS